MGPKKTQREANDAAQAWPRPTLNLARDTDLFDASPSLFYRSWRPPMPLREATVLLCGKPVQKPCRNGALGITTHHFCRSFGA